MEDDKLIQMTWIGDEKTTLESHQMAEDAILTVKRINNKYETLTESRVVGLIIEFWCNTGSYACQRESRVDQQLAEEYGVVIPPSTLFTDCLKKNNLLWDQVASGNNLHLRQNDPDYNPRRYAMSLTKKVKDGFNNYVDKSDNWHSRNKIELLSNMIIEFDQSVFVDRFDRLEAKELVLRQLDGEAIDPDMRTDAYQKIYMGGFGEELADDLIDAYEKSISDSDDEYKLPAERLLADGSTVETTVDVRDIDEDDGLMIDPRYRHIQADIPQTQKVRVPLTLSFIRFHCFNCLKRYRLKLKDGADRPESALVQFNIAKGFCNQINDDYKTENYIWDNYVKDQLEIIEFKGNEYVFMSESQIPDHMNISDRERVEAKFAYIHDIATSRANDRTIKGSINAVKGIDLSPTMINGHKVSQVHFAEYVVDNDLEHICDHLIDYLLDGLDRFHDHYEHKDWWDYMDQ